MDDGLRQPGQGDEPAAAVFAEVEIEIAVRRSQHVEQDRHVSAEQEDLFEHLRHPIGRYRPSAGRSARRGEHGRVLVERQERQLGPLHLPPVSRVQARKPVEKEAERALVERAAGRDAARDVVHQHPAFAASAMESDIDGRTRKRRRKIPGQPARPQSGLIEWSAEQLHPPRLGDELLQHEPAGVAPQREDVCRNPAAVEPSRLEALDPRRPPSATQRRRQKAGVRLAVDHRQSGDQSVGQGGIQIVLHRLAHGPSYVLSTSPNEA